MNFIDEVKQGAPFRIDLKSRSLKVGKNHIIKCGEFTTDPILYDCVNVAQEMIEELFFDYYNSGYEVGMPKNVLYQKKKLDEMDDSDMICGMNGHLARFKLEFFTLIGIINGSLNWALEDMNKRNRFFWKSEKYPKLIILKDFFNYQ